MRQHGGGRLGLSHVLKGILAQGRRGGGRSGVRLRYGAWHSRRVEMVPKISGNPSESITYTIKSTFECMCGSTGVAAPTPPQHHDLVSLVVFFSIYRVLSAGDRVLPRLRVLPRRSTSYGFETMMRSG